MTRLLNEIIELVEREFFDTTFLKERWNAIKVQVQEDYAKATSVAERERLLNTLLVQIGTSHTLLITPELSAKIDRAEQEKTESALSYEEVDGVLFAELTSFQVRSIRREERAKFADALAEVDTLILDMRVNSGGSCSAVASFASLFLLPNLPVANVRDREGLQRKHATISPPIPEEENIDHAKEVELMQTHHYLQFQTGGEEMPHFSGEVVILISKDCYSCGEVFVQVMKEEGRAKVVGERSSGAVVAGTVYELRNGYSLLLPFALIESGRGTVLEGRGVEPDVEMSFNEMTSQKIVRELRHQKLIG
ncbi:MAG: hypothetical protein KDD67_13205 [Ignavibacteriae bacterium]|nr:hypothetical protein [Ignavibacteriota bacterium]MCB9214435.1 hypothetical protein [Ignavibacteria bacterium]